jgi:OmpA-OmpF porin, OOP family
MRTLRMSLVCTLFVLLAPFGTPTLAEAQSIGERLRARAAQRIDERTNQAIDNTVNRAEKAINCVVTDTACIDKAGKEGQQVVLTDNKGTPLPDQQQPSRQRVGEGAWANFDFVPGERILFADDFSRDRVGNVPARIELLTGNPEVVEWQGTRWLRMGDFTAFTVPLPETLPERFTVEFDLTLPWSASGFYSEPSELTYAYYAPGHKTSAVLMSGTEVGVYRNDASPGKSTLDPRTLFPDLFDEGSWLSRPIRFSMQVDGRYIKLYMNEHRVSNLPNGNFGRGNSLTFEFDGTNERVDAPLISNISINAGGTPMYDALLNEGRFITRGILFDTNSDRIRPESTPTLREIGEMLRAHPDLRLLVEGHTDGVGQPAANQILSEKRAAAVLHHLITESGIAAARLESRGLGASMPAASNDTPEGRQTNRRVELVRL